MHRIGELPAVKVMRKRFPRLKASDGIKRVISALLKTDASVVPVFEKGRFKGEVHELDLLKLMVDPREIPEDEIVVLGFGMDMGYFARKAGDIMRRHSLSASPGTKVKDVSYTMLRENVKAIPVIERGRLLGIITERDILKRAMKEGVK